MAIEREKMLRQVQELRLHLVTVIEGRFGDFVIHFRDRRLKLIFYINLALERSKCFFGGDLTERGEYVTLVPLSSVGAALSALLGTSRLDDAGRSVLVTARLCRGKLSYVVVGPGEDKRTLGDDPVFRDWIAGEVTDGMLLDYVWDLFGWS